jgi:3-oxoacyl-[acyl-carrier-protein] synthase-3
MAIADFVHSTGDCLPPQADHSYRAAPAHSDAPVAEKRPRCHSRIGRLMGVQVAALGSYVPERCVRNEDLAALGYDADWIVQRTGITERRPAPPGVSTGDLATEAARRCLAAGNIRPEEIDLVLLGTYTPDMLIPATANVVQHRLGICAPALDVQAACASFAFALITGMQFVATGCNQAVLVIGAECNSRVVNPADKQTYPLFGDGAGAVVLAPGGSDQGILAYAVGSDGSGEELICRPAGGAREPYSAADPARHFLRMDGRPVFKWAIRTLKETVREVLDTAGMELDEIDLVVFHQANLRIIRAAADELGIAPEKVFNNLDRYGNTSSASIPWALDEAHAQGRIGHGDHVLFSGFGAGLTWGTVLMRW